MLRVSVEEDEENKVVPVVYKYMAWQDTQIRFRLCKKFISLDVNVKTDVDAVKVYQGDTGRYERLFPLNLVLVFLDCYLNN